MTQRTIKPFGKWRQRLWPVHHHELKKFLPLFLLKFLFTINFSLLGSSTKDTLVVTAPGSGAEIIPILKGWVVLPISFLMLLIYTKLTNKYSQERLFYIVLISFLAFFLLFGFVLYPYREQLSPTIFCDWLQDMVGDARSHWVVVIRYWVNSVFFVFAELWGAMVLVLLFWSFANNINTIEEAKRSYTLYVAAGNFAPAVSGFLICSCCGIGQDFTLTVQKIITVVSFVIVLAALIYWWLQRYVVTDEALCPPEMASAVKKNKPKLSLRQSIKFVLSSKYILCIAILVIGYACAINLVEVTWKACIKLQYPNANDYQYFMGVLNKALGFTTPIVALLVSGNLMRKLGWYRTAQFAPFVVGILGVVFMGACFFKEQLAPVSAWIGISPLLFVVIFGFIHNVLSKAVKYSIFDPTKEMAFIPLDHESKTKGKAAVDVVGSRFGKAGSSWMQAILIEFIGLGSILGTTHVTAGILVLIVVFWLMALSWLKGHFAQETDQGLTAN